MTATAQRARGGGLKEKFMAHEKKGADDAKETMSALKKRAAGGAVARKSGGTVPGKMPAVRPDRRARGGATGDNPFSAAHNMSTLPYERVGAKPNGGGEGKDKDPDR